MDILKKYFKIAFGAKDKDSFLSLLIMVVIAAVVCSVAGWLLSKIPLIGWVFGLALGLCGLYLAITLVLGVLVFLGIIQ